MQASAPRLPSSATSLPVGPAAPGSWCTLRSAFRRDQAGDGSCHCFRRAEFAHIVSVRRHHVDTPVDCRRNVAEELLDLRIALDFDQRIIATRHDALPEEDLDPAFLAEKFLVLAEDAPV